MEGRGAATRTANKCGIPNRMVCASVAIVLHDSGVAHLLVQWTEEPLKCSELNLLLS